MRGLASLVAAERTSAVPSLLAHKNLIEGLLHRCGIWRARLTSDFSASQHSEFRRLLNQVVRGGGGGLTKLYDMLRSDEAAARDPPGLFRSYLASTLAAPGSRSQQPSQPICLGRAQTTTI
jgi:hypothetical protein